MTVKRRYLTIGQVSKKLNLKSYTLRYWESEVDALKPLYIEDRRFYDAKQVQTIERLKALIVDKGLTVKSAGQAVKRNLFTITESSTSCQIKDELTEVLGSLSSLLSWVSDDDSCKA
jgi:DNA-binding transcriptional MerR regulator